MWMLIAYTSILISSPPISQFVCANRIILAHSELWLSDGTHAGCRRRRRRDAHSHLQIRVARHVCFAANGEAACRTGGIST